MSHFARHRAAERQRVRQHAQEQVRDQPETQGEGVVDEAVLSAGGRDRDEIERSSSK